MAKYEYEAEEILEEYANSYSQVEKEQLAQKIKSIVEEKLGVFAEKVKERIHLCENISQDTDDCLCEDINDILQNLAK